MYKKQDVARAECFRGPGKDFCSKTRLNNLKQNNSSSVITDLGDTGSYFMENIFSDVLLNVAADGWLASLVADSAPSPSRSCAVASRSGRV